MLLSTLFCFGLYSIATATAELIDIESVDVGIDSFDISTTQQVVEVTVTRVDDIVDDGELVAERSSSIVFDFVLDESRKTLCMNNAVLDMYKTEPQRIETLAVVVPQSGDMGQLREDLSALPMGLVTADVSLKLDPMDDGSLLITAITDILELEDCVLLASESVESLIVIPAATRASWNLQFADDTVSDADYLTCTASPNPFVSFSCKTFDWVVRGFVFCFVIAPLIGFGIGWLGMLGIAKAFGLFSRRRQYQQLDAEESLTEEKPPAYNADTPDEKSSLITASD